LGHGGTCPIKRRPLASTRMDAYVLRINSRRAASILAASAPQRCAASYIGPRIVGFPAIFARSPSYYAIAWQAGAAV
jgi:hypothetical protein